MDQDQTALKRAHEKISSDELFNIIRQQSKKQNLFRTKHRCQIRVNLLYLLCLMFSCVFCDFPMWCPGSGVVLGCMDSSSLPSSLR